MSKPSFNSLPWQWNVKVSHLQRERKKVNLILYNVKESSESNRDARVRHDINMVKQVGDFHIPLPW